jgi:hypothetical protein
VDFQGEGRGRDVQGRGGWTVRVKGKEEGSGVMCGVEGWEGRILLWVLGFGLKVPGL